MIRLTSLLIIYIGAIKGGISNNNKNYINLIFHWVDGGVVELAEGVEGDVLHLVHRLPGLLQLEHSMSSLVYIFM